MVSLKFRNPRGCFQATTACMYDENRAAGRSLAVGLRWYTEEYTEELVHGNTECGHGGQPECYWHPCLSQADHRIYVPCPSPCCGRNKMDAGLHHLRCRADYRPHPMTPPSWSGRVLIPSSICTASLSLFLATKQPPVEDATLSNDNQRKMPNTGCLSVARRGKSHCPHLISAILRRGGGGACCWNEYLVDSLQESHHFISIEAHW